MACVLHLVNLITVRVRGLSLRHTTDSLCSMLRWKTTSFILVYMRLQQNVCVLLRLTLCRQWCLMRFHIVYVNALLATLNARDRLRLSKNKDMLPLSNFTGSQLNPGSNIFNIVSFSLSQVILGRQTDAFSSVLVLRTNLLLRSTSPGIHSRPLTPHLQRIASLGLCESYWETQTHICTSSYLLLSCVSVMNFYALIQDAEFWSQ